MRPFPPRLMSAASSTLRTELIKKYSLGQTTLRTTGANDSKLTRKPCYALDPALTSLRSPVAIPLKLYLKSLPDDIVSHLGDISSKYILELNPGLSSCFPLLFIILCAKVLASQRRRFWKEMQSAWTQSNPCFDFILDYQFVVVGR